MAHWPQAASHLATNHSGVGGEGVEGLLKDQKGHEGEPGVSLHTYPGEGTLQAWPDEVPGKHQLSAQAGTRSSAESLPAQGLWIGFSWIGFAWQKGRGCRKPEGKQNFVVEALTEAGAMAAEWRQEVTCKSVRSQPLLALKAEQLKRRK